MVTKSADREPIGEELCFLGEFEHALDRQRRIAIPKTWRKACRNLQFVIIPGRERILQLIPRQTFQEEFINKARKVSFANANGSLALARLGSRAQECNCDKQGRIQVPQRLLEYAKIKERVMLIGAVSTIQIWPVAVWEKQQIADESYLDEVQRIGESSLE